MSRRACVCRRDQLWYRFLFELLNVEHFHFRTHLHGTINGRRSIQSSRPPFVSPQLTMGSRHPSSKVLRAQATNCVRHSMENLLEPPGHRPVNLITAPITGKVKVDKCRPTVRLSNASSISVAYVCSRDVIPIVGSSLVICNNDTWPGFLLP